MQIRVIVTQYHYNVFVIIDSYLQVLHFYSQYEAAMTCVEAAVTTCDDSQTIVIREMFAHHTIYIDGQCGKTPRMKGIRGV